MLVCSAALAIVQMIVAVAAATGEVGLPKLASNRDGLPPFSGWAGRAQRAHLNMLENLGIFALSVLVAKMTARADATTALGATIFFWARLIYAIVYLAGIPWLRT